MSELVRAVNPDQVFNRKRIMKIINETKVIPYYVNQSTLNNTGSKRIAFDGKLRDSRSDMF